ncbi:MAG TPA: hypothetical protein VF619_01985 [Allosphingosinicella sp.]|jgi:hypothetical protein
MSDAAVFEGVLHAEGVTFNSSPDRSVFSFLYDNFAVEWLPGDRGDDESRTVTRRLHLAAGRGSIGHLLVLELRGTSLGSLAEDAALTVQVGKSSETVPLSRSEEDPNINHRIAVPLDEDRAVVAIVVTATIPKPEEGVQSTIQIDTIDITLAPAAE